ncbi:MAG: glycosyltransferase [Dehalococcoidia bacterium]|nr:glycosyltransferase [Dehalococcoidia bacterium]
MSVAIDIGILTRGKSTLSMALSSLLLQDGPDIRIYIVDTADSPVIKREDVIIALKLAAERGIACEYVHIREKERAFSVGRLKILEYCTGSHVCFMDDDIAMPSSALPRTLSCIEQNGAYGYIVPQCRNANPLGRLLLGPQHFAPGGVFYQDAVVRSILTEYYSTTVDVLDRKNANDKVWEIAFLSEIFPALGRKCVVQPDNVIYHLDYGERPAWDLLSGPHVRRSVGKARELASRLCAVQPGGKPGFVQAVR